jgi:uncharacterized phiE125 gp8 family phage protein
MQLICTTDPGNITEPITADDVKTFMGYPLSEQSQDLLIEGMITSAREWLEQRTALSLVSKDYKVYFEPGEADDGWYELPISPVIGTPVVSMNGVVTTFEQKGLSRIFISASSVISTILIGQVTAANYIEIEFTAGATNKGANDVLMELVSFKFNNREGSTTLNIASLPYDLRGRINALSMNF